MEENTSSNKEDKEIKYKKFIIKGILILITLFIILILNNAQASVSSKLGFISKKYFNIILLIFICLDILLIILLIVNKYKQIFKNNDKYLYKTLDYSEFISFTLSVLLFVFIYLTCPTTISGSSMNNTLASNDKVFVTTLFYKPKKDDIVIVDVNEHYTNLDETYYVKRVVGTENDEISFTSNGSSLGDLYIAGELIESNISYLEYKILLTDIYTSTCYLDYEKETQTIPLGYSVVLGDNRKNSKDSRSIGLIHNSDIIGKVYFRYFSLSKGFGIINKDIKY